MSRRNREAVSEKFQRVKFYDDAVLFSKWGYWNQERSHGLCSNPRHLYTVGNAVNEIVNIGRFQIANNIFRINSTIYSEWNNFWGTDAIIRGNEDFQQVWAQLAIENVTFCKYCLISDRFVFTDGFPFCKFAAFFGIFQVKPLYR